MLLCHLPKNCYLQSPSFTCFSGDPPKVPLILYKINMTTESMCAQVCKSTHTGYSYYLVPWIPYFLLFIVVFTLEEP